MQNRMWTYALLNDNEIYGIWSDNEAEETMDLVPMHLIDTFDCEVHTAEPHSYSEVVCTDRNIAILTSRKESVKGETPGRDDAISGNRYWAESGPAFACYFLAFFLGVLTRV